MPGLMLTLNMVLVNQLYVVKESHPPDCQEIREATNFDL